MAQYHGGERLGGRWKGGEGVVFGGSGGSGFVAW